MIRAVCFLLGLALAAVLCLPVNAGKPFPESWTSIRQPLPAWLATPNYAIDVRWVRAYSTVPDVREGVCTVYSLDRDEVDLYGLQAQVDACLAQGLRAGAGPLPAGVVRLHWHEVANPIEVWKRSNDVFTYVGFPNLVGFYFHPDPAGPCHVITAARYRALGHELLHCIKGWYHDGNGRHYAQQGSAP
jgi:hypothetical protein